jgi:hypothetical protein
MTFDPRPPNVHLIVLSSESRHSALGHVGSRVANQAVSVRRAGRSICLSICLDRIGMLRPNL